MKLTALLIALTIVLSGCHNSNDDNQASSIQNKSEETKKKIIPKGKIYTYRSAYYHWTDNGDNPEIRTELVREKFQNLPIHLSDDSIFLGNSAFSIRNAELNTRSFFTRKYVYDYYKSAFKLGYNENLGDQVKVVSINFEGDVDPDLLDSFFEGGYAIVVGKNLYLSYKRFIIQYSCEPLKKSQLCDLPFDMWQDWRFCEYDERDLNCDFCASEFPIYLLKKVPELKSSLEKLIHEEGRVIKYIHKINTKKDNPEVYIVIAQSMEESNGDNFIVIRNKKNELVILKDTENEFLHSYFFTISKSLKVTMYENTGYTPKQKVNSEFQIQADGTYSKL
ncbi:hypothetical protein [Fluviicola taffensis]|uniref:hypothetical protein n=1 Tax=Fluviicola taffensis TaxID=191579 RepID=UPI0031379078